MHPNTITTLIQAGLPTATVTVDGDGTHFNAVVIAPDLLANPEYNVNKWFMIR